MKNVIYDQKTFNKLQVLAVKLYNKKYFSFEDNAEEYVNNITYFIENEIEFAHKRRAVSKTKFYAKNQFFITYKANKRTSWYIYFVEDNGNYIITHIDNNHVNPRIRGLRK